MGALLFFKESADGFHHFICAVALDLVQHICDSGFKSGHRAQIHIPKCFIATDRVHVFLCGIILMCYKTKRTFLSSDTV